MCLLTCKTPVQLSRYLEFCSGFRECMILEIWMGETGNSGGQIAAQLYQWSNERWTLTKAWNTWYEVENFSVAVVLWVSFSTPFSPKATWHVTKKKKKVLCSVFIAVFFYDQTKIGPCLECFFRLLVLVFFFAYVFVLFLTFISTCVQLYQATSWYLIDNRLGNCCSKSLACRKKLIFILSASRCSRGPFHTSFLYPLAALCINFTR